MCLIHSSARFRSKPHAKSRTHPACIFSNGPSGAPGKECTKKSAAACSAANAECSNDIAHVAERP